MKFLVKRRHVLAILGVVPLGGALLQRLVKPAFGKDADEYRSHKIAAIADVMFPGDGLPGASALGIHLQVAAMEDFRPLMATGIAWLDNYATVQGASDFLTLNEQQKEAALDAAFASRDPGIQSFVLALRSHLGVAYYSRPEIKSAFAYTAPPQPLGFSDFERRPA